jgi:alpha-beta hydrolase superfamily lysophospholipase
LPKKGKNRAANWITNQDHMLDILLKFKDRIAPGEHFVIAGSSYGGYLVRGIVHHRSDHLDGLAITVPVIKKSLPICQYTVQLKRMQPFWWLYGQKNRIY